jgi:phosphatidate cytidylyltransferase
MTPELKKRLLTGFGGGAALLGLIIFGGWIGMFFISTALSIGMMVEFTDITFSMRDRLEKRYILLSVAWAIALVNLFTPQSEFTLLIVTFISLFVYFLYSASKHEEAEFQTHFKELMYSVFALIYLVFIPLFFSRIYSLPHGVEWTVLFLLVVWAGDSGAYFIGKKYGKRKLYSKISPKKTVEGLVGGLFASTIATIAFRALFFPNMMWEAILVVALGVGFVSQMGDLCESFFKRAFDKKDSGTVLPGHGGFLDRFDGVVFSLPVMYTFVRIFS